MVTPIVGVCNCSMFCCTLLYVHSSIAIILMGKRELVALLNLSYWCLVMVERLFLTVPWGCLRFVIVVFPDYTHLLFLSRTISAKNLVDRVSQSLINIRERQWTEAVLQLAELRTQRASKPFFGRKEYLDRFLSIQQRSAVARFRCGSFPLAVWLGRYRRPVIPLE